MRPGTQLANIGNMPDEQESPAPGNAARNGRPRKQRWLAVVLALGLSAAGIFVWLHPQRASSAAEGGAAESTLALETFVVNLNVSGQRAYLRAGITLGLAHPLPRQAAAVPKALIRDTILSVLATAQPEELLRVEGKRRLKEELLKALQERVPQLAVANVYFTEFLVQM